MTKLLNAALAFKTELSEITGDNWPIIRMIFKKTSFLKLFAEYQSYHFNGCGIVLDPNKVNLLGIPLIDEFHEAAKLQQAQRDIENLKMVCRRLAAATTIETRNKIADQCRPLFEGSIIRGGE